MLLKMATAPSLPGTAGPRLSRTQQCAGPSALSAGTCHHLPCLARCVVQEALFRAHLQCGVPFKAIVLYITKTGYNLNIQ